MPREQLDLSRRFAYLFEPLDDVDAGGGKPGSPRPPLPVPPPPSQPAVSSVPPDAEAAPAPAPAGATGGPRTGRPLPAVPRAPTTRSPISVHPEPHDPFANQDTPDDDGEPGGLLPGVPGPL